MFRTVPLSIIRSFSLYTQQWYMSYRFADSLRAGSGRSVLNLLASRQQNFMTYNHCCVYSENPDNGQRNCPKHVEFYSKNKFEKLAHLVGFIIRIYHDARSPERQKKYIIPCSSHKLGLKIGGEIFSAIRGSFSAFLAVSFILDVSFRIVLFSYLCCTVSFLQYSPSQPSPVTLTSEAAIFTASDSLYCVHVPDSLATGVKAL